MYSCITVYVHAHNVFMSILAATCGMRMLPCMHEFMTRGRSLVPRRLKLNYIKINTDALHSCLAHFHFGGGCRPA